MTPVPTSAEADRLDGEGLRLERECHGRDGTGGAPRFEGMGRMTDDLRRSSSTAPSVTHDPPAAVARHRSIDRCPRRDRPTREPGSASEAIPGDAERLGDPGGRRPADDVARVRGHPRSHAAARTRPRAPVFGQCRGDLSSEAASAAGSSRRRAVADPAPPPRPRAIRRRDGRPGTARPAGPAIGDGGRRRVALGGRRRASGRRPRGACRAARPGPRATPRRRATASNSGALSSCRSRW